MADTNEGYPEFPIGTTVYSHVFYDPETPKTILTASWDGIEYRYTVVDTSGVKDTGYLAKDFTTTQDNTMLKHTKGNLIDLAEEGKFDVIVHGCNCFNTMGSGIAKEIRERYPDAYVVDTEYHEALAGDYGDPFVLEKLGNYTECMSDHEKFTIVNAYTQVDYHPRGVDHFEYDSFKMILRKLAIRFPDKRFGFPYIGMGLAGGDKARIIKMLEDFAEKVSATGGSVTLVEFG